MSGKGDKQRPRLVSKETFDSNWDAIFKKKEQKEEPAVKQPDCAEVKPYDTIDEK